MRHCGIVLGVLWLCTGCGSSSGPADVSSRSAQTPDEVQWQQFQDAYVSFVARHNHTQRGDLRPAPAGIEVEAVYIPELGTTDALDEAFVRRVFSAWLVLRQDPKTQETISRYRMQYRQVLQRVAEEGLPDVFASVPFVLSGFHAEAISPTCGAGLWMLQPEVTTVAQSMEGLAMDVAECPVRHADGTYSIWNPKAGPTTILADVPLGQDACMISNLEKSGASICGKDDRLDSVRATDFAVRAMAATWNDARVRASGMSVEWALLDAGEGIGQTSAIPATYTDWREQSPHQSPHEFGSALLGCAANPSAAGCTTVGALRQQPPGQFAVDVLAVHFNVVCIMGTQYRADLPRYASFHEQYVGDGTLCGPEPRE